MIRIYNLPCFDPATLYFKSSTGADMESSGVRSRLNNFGWVTAIEVDRDRWQRVAITVNYGNEGQGKIVVELHQFDWGHPHVMRGAEAVLVGGYCSISSSRVDATIAWWEATGLLADGGTGEVTGEAR